MRLKPYPEYKNSSIEWLGDVPVDWNVVSIKWISPVQRGASPRPIDDQKYFDEDGEYAWVRIADVSSSDGVLRETTQRLSELGNSLSVKIYPNELFVSIAGTVGKPCISAIKACIHDGFVYFPKLNIPAIFLYRIFEAGTCYGGLGKFGTQLNLNTDTIGSIRIALPPKSEIDNIIDFLDLETGKLNTLISKQEHLIELLQEKRQAIISNAVTKGLNPDTKMKDSGVEWLGMVPEGWEAASIKWFTRIYSGGTPDKSNDSYWADGTIPWLNSGSVNDDIITEPSNYITEEAFEKSSAKWIPKNALVIALAGQGKTKGMVAQLAIDTTCNQSMAAIIPISKITSRFLFWWLKANYQNIRNLAGGDLRDGLNLEMIGGIYTPIPPLTDQDEITEFLDRETTKIDTLIDKAKHSIELAKEHRSALISAAVTGKIDVREAA